MIRTSLFLGLAVATLATACGGYSAKTWIVDNPAPLFSGGKRHLAWEVAVTNTSDAPVRLAELAVEVEGKKPYTLNATELLGRARLVVRGKRPAKGPQQPGVLQPDDTVIIYLWHSFEHKDALPLTVAHLVRLKPVEEGAEGLDKSIIAKVIDLKPRVVQAPLRGQGWFAANASSPVSGHRKAVQVREDTLYLAQRYAVDFVLAKQEGTRLKGSDAKDNKNYFAYGKDAVAVAKGVVVKVVDGIPENVPGLKSRAVKITNDTLAGNAVILDIGDGYYVTYGHFIPGSLAVKQGDVVAAGQVLGKVGNSGNSSEPHLHLHVCDKPSILA